jgi:hypothetical protein
MLIAKCQYMITRSTAPQIGPRTTLLRSAPPSPGASRGAVPGTGFALADGFVNSGPVAAPTVDREGTGVGVKPSKYWSQPKREFDVDIAVYGKKTNHYDFDFKPNKQLSNNKVQGYVDGPWDHNGCFEILENSPKNFKLKAKFGNNDAHDNDMKVVLQIRNGIATVSGTVKGKDLPKNTSSAVRGSGTGSDPFRLEFKDENKQRHVLTWRPD